MNSPAAPTLHCPLCHYNLTGLSNPQCPECGHTFEWADLTDPARQTLPWLFEHRRWLRGFLPTHLRLLWPPVFFSILKPIHRISVRRLWLFNLISVALLLVLVLVPPILAATHGLYTRNLAERARLAAEPSELSYFRGYAAYANLSDAQIIERVYPRPATLAFWQSVLPSTRSQLMLYDRGNYNSYPPRLLIAAVIPVTFLSATLLLALCLRTTLRQARITARQAFRFFVYCLDPFVLFLFAFAIVLYYIHGISTNPFAKGYPLSRILLETYRAAIPPILGLLLPFTLLLVFRLHFAARNYLRVPHTLGITAANLTIAFLLFAVTMKYTGWYWLL